MACLYAFISPLIVIALKACYRLTRPETYARKKLVKDVTRYRYQPHYRLLSDVYVFDQYAQPTKIPEIIISRYGVFVIEYCSAKHEIFGSDCINRWYSYRNNHYLTFRNPHHQMAKLKNDLSLWYDIPIKTIYTVVIFTRSVSFNYQALKRTGRPECILKILDNFNDVQIDSAALRRIHHEIESSPQHITIEPKRCIIKNRIIEPVSV